MSEVFPFQENSTLPSRTLNWIGRVEPRNTPLPTVILQECLIVFIKKQVVACSHLKYLFIFTWLRLNMSDCLLLYPAG